MPMPARRSARVAVPLLTALLLGMSVLAWVVVPLPVHGVALLSPQLDWWLLAPGFAVVEVVVLHVHTRMESQSVSLSEVPLVLALFLAPPWAMLVAAVVGPGLVFAVHRRQAPAKLAFNLAVRVCAVTVTLSVFHVLGRLPPAAGATADRTWLWIAAVLATMVASAVETLLVMAVIALHDASVTRGQVYGSLTTVPGVAAVVACGGLVAVEVLHADPRTGLLLLVIGGGMLLGYRAHATLNDRRVSLERLHALSVAVTGAGQGEEILHSVLEGALESLRADVAEIVLAAPADAAGGGRRASVGAAPRFTRTALTREDSTVHSRPLDLRGEGEVWLAVLESGQPLLLPRSTRVPAERDQLAGLGYREAILVPLCEDGGVVGAMAVGQTAGVRVRYDEQDLQLLQQVADQARLALRTGRLMERLEYESTHDSLTGLANPGTFRRELEAVLAAHTRGGSGLTVILIDIDSIPEVNASLGLHSGDLLLCETAQRLVEAAPPAALVARFSGNGFAVLLPGVTVPGVAAAVGSELMERVTMPATVDQVEVRVRACAGAALAPRHARDVGRLLRGAAAALDLSRTAGGGLRLYDHSDLAPSGQTQLAFAADMRRALLAGEITVYVQPQAVAATGHVIGAEALVRWNHPTLGLLSPIKFVPAAERHGLMADLTAVVLDRAAAAAAQWQAQGLDLTVAVNLSPRGLGEDDVTHALQAALASYGLPPHLVTLEITEDGMIGDPERATALLVRLRELGVGISVDDFGTGYASLSYLRRLPATEVKIDRSFVSRMITDPDDAVIVRSIVDLARNLGLHVVAEGVEDRATWDRLADLGCDAIQGYYLSRPMPVEDLPAWLAGHRSRWPGADVAAGVPPQRGNGGLRLG